MKYIETEPYKKLQYILDIMTKMLETEDCLEFSDEWLYRKSIHDKLFVLLINNFDHIDKIDQITDVDYQTAVKKVSELKKEYVKRILQEDIEIHEKRNKEMEKIKKKYGENFESEQAFRRGFLHGFARANMSSDIEISEVAAWANWETGEHFPPGAMTSFKILVTKE